MNRFSSPTLACMSVAVFAAFPARAGGKLDYNQDIRAILAEHCFDCHGPDEAQRKAKLRLDEREAALSMKALLPGQPEQSEMIKRILSTDPEEVMPPPKHKRGSLTDVEKQKLEQWVREGAEYKKHWAFIPPMAAPVPTVENAKFGIQNPIDAFVHATLEERGLSPTPPATPEQWLRRVTFTLTGLPPTIEELDRFQQDASQQARIEVVNRLLSSSAYGEQMARDWLDAARYADSYGRHEDGEMIVWPWRDWVIKSFNNNLPYNVFIQWQTAGDLMPKPTREQIVATAFNRLAQQSNESGSDPEEFRIDQVGDRVRANGLAFMGLTIECAKCHDHKYDPISQKEYWQMAAFFDNINENGVYSQFCPKTVPSPSLLLPDEAQEAKMNALRVQISAKEQELKKVSEEARANYESWIAGEGVPGSLKSGAWNSVKSWFGKGETHEWVANAKAHFDFDGEIKRGKSGLREIVNRDDHDKPATLRTKLEQIEDGDRGSAVLFNGDDEITVPGMGEFHEYDDFSFALWMQPRESRERAVVIACSRGGVDDGRGYEVIMEHEVLSFSLMHFHPGNEIRIRAKQALPLNEWTHLAFTYDGSSRADGLKIYLNGAVIETEVVADHLNKDIVRRAEWGDIERDEVRFTLGGREHDSPLKNCAVDDYWVFGRAISAGEVKQLSGTEASADDWYAWWLWSRHQPAKEVRRDLEKLRIELTTLTNDVLEMMVMEEMPQRRPQFIRTRGDHRLKADPVEPDVIHAVLPFSDELPRNRLGFAQWLTSREHPLTARVAVNRFWQMFFGRGLVGTSEDFGTRGELPSHPELLDWLAVDLMDHGWDVKRLCSMIALSSTFAQGSTPSDAKALEHDPRNKWLARGPQLRLTAEEVRDQALATSGLLKRKVGGPSVFPYIPDGLYDDTGLQQDYVMDVGDGLYRRSLYTFWRRTLPPPDLAAFDAPSREFCVMQREKTSTPLQALVLLNDPQFVEAQRVLAERVLSQHPQDLTAACTLAFCMLTSRSASEEEKSVLSSMVQQQVGYFAAKQEEAEKLMTNGRHHAAAQLPVKDLAATTMVIRALMSHIETVNR